MAVPGAPQLPWRGFFSDVMILSSCHSCSASSILYRADFPREAHDISLCLLSLSSVLFLFHVLVLPLPSWLSLIHHHQHEMLLCYQSLAINLCILVLYPPTFQTCAFVQEILHCQSSFVGVYISLPIFVFVLFCFGDFL